jgi:Ca-activated chloride channel family protein
VSFDAPAYLLLLVLLPLGALLYGRSERRRRRGREAFAAPALLPAVAPRPLGRLRHVPIALYGAALAALVVALARPQTTVAVPVEQASVVLAFDHSGSMAARDVQPSRLAAARRAADRFLGAVPDQVRVGAVAFNTAPKVIQGPTRDRDAVRAALAELRPQGGTATGDALDLALRTARRPARPRAAPPPAAIVLLTDGASVRGKDPVVVARDAARRRVPVYTVALGTRDGTIEVPSREGGTVIRPVPPDPDSLRRIAEASGGRAYTAEDAGELSAVYGRLGSQIAKEREPREITAAFAAGAFAALAAAALASLRLFGRLP